MSKFVFNLQLFAEPRDTGNVLQDRRVVDMSDEIALLEPSKTPLITLTKRLNKRVATNPEFNWLEDELGARWDAVNQANEASVGTSVVVDNASYFAVDDIVKVPRTGEVMRVTAVDTATNTLTVVRGYGTTTAALLVDNDPLVIIGNAIREFSSAPTIKDKQEVKKTNYTQIFRTPFGVSRTLDKSKMYGGKDIAYLRKKKGIEHAVDIERAFLFGEPKEDLTGDTPRRTTGGVLYWITTNVVDVGTSLTEVAFEEWCETVFRYGSDTKLLLASARLVSVINQWAAGKLQTVPKDKTYGIAVQQYLSAHGELYIVKHHLLEGNIYGKMGIALDMDKLAYRPLQGSDTKLKLNIQNNDEDGEKDEYITEAGLELKNEKCHAVIKGFTN